MAKGMFHAIECQTQGINWGELAVSCWSLLWDGPQSCVRVISVSWDLFLFITTIVIIKIITTIIIFYIGSVDKLFLSQSLTFNYIILLILHPIPSGQGHEGGVVAGYIIAGWG